MADNFWFVIEFTVDGTLSEFEQALIGLLKIIFSRS